MMAAMACLVSLIIRVPVMPAGPFLTYDPKDVIIVIGGFIFGPLSALTLAAVAALVEMPISGTGPWGWLMNFVSSSAFALPAALMYKYRRTMGGAITGLAAGLAVVVLVMVPMNILVVPIWMGAGREWVIDNLIPVFIPFNAIKYGLNGAVALVAYKPVVTALAESGLLPPLPEGGGKKTHLGILIIAGLVILGLAVAITVMQLTK
jgi:riboflavin transporter FmnP